MAGPSATVPYHDPFDRFDTPCTENILNFNENLNPNLEDLSSFSVPFTFDHSIPPSGDDNIQDQIDPFDDPVMWGVYNDGNFENLQAAPLVTEGETSNRREASDEDVRQLLVWPPPTSPFFCSCCQVLREIIHTNGNHTTKLEIHGRLGMICHAILANRYSVNPIVPQECQHQMFDFCKKSIEDVKQFLVQHCEERKKAGYILLQDPLSIFYEALCVGLDWDNDLNTDEFFEPPSGDSGACQVNQPEAESEEERNPKSSLAAQRERTGKLTLRDFIEYFHLPIEDAAKQIGVCPTVVKKICRKHGMNRWPHRKIKSIDRQISILRVSLNAATAEEKTQIRAMMEKLQQERMDIYAPAAQS